MQTQNLGLIILLLKSRMVRECAWCGIGWSTLEHCLLNHKGFGSGQIQRIWNTTKHIWDELDCFFCLFWQWATNAELLKVWHVCWEWVKSPGRLVCLLGLQGPPQQSGRWSEMLKFIVHALCPWEALLEGWTAHLLRPVLGVCTESILRLFFLSHPTTTGRRGGKETVNFVIVFRDILRSFQTPASGEEKRKRFAWLRAAEGNLGTSFCKIGSLC